MSENKTLLGLTPLSIEILSACFGVCLIGLGVRLALTPNIDLKVANHRLAVGSSAKRLELLAEKLERQAEIIEQKDEAYEELYDTYKRSLKGNRGYGRLQQKIEKVKALPDIEPIDEVIGEIEATEEILNDSLSE